MLSILAYFPYVRKFSDFLQYRFFLIQSTEAFSDDLAAVCDRYESGRLVFVDEVTEFYRLAALHDRENDCLIVMLISTFRMIYGCTAV